MKISNLHIAQVKRANEKRLLSNCGIIEKENYNKPKSEDARQPNKKWENAKGIVKWIADKGVDVGIALLPLLMQIK